MNAILHKTLRCLACIAVVSLLLVSGGVSTGHAIGPTVQSMVAAYYSNTNPDFLRSATPMSLPDGTGTVSQTANLDGTATTALSGVPAYGDSAIGVDAGLLGNLNGILIQGTGDAFGLNLWFDVDGNSEYFTWSGDTYTGVGGDKYILGPSSASGVLQVTDSTSFTSLNPGGGNYTLAQLKAGLAAGIGASTPVRLWIGVCCNGTKSATLQSIYISSGTITDFYIDAAFTDGNAGGHIFGVDAFNVIQDAINAAGPGATVHVAAGTYTEQLSISKSLTLIGANPATVIVQPPDVLSACWGSKKPIICVENTDANITDLTVDGAGKGNANYQFVGIGYHNASGAVSGNKIIGIRNNPLDGMQSGAGFYALNEDASPHTITVTGNDVHDYQKGGIVLNGNNLTGDAENNTVTGAGPTTLIAMNGIQFGFGAGGLAKNNTVTGNAWTGTYGGSNDPLTDPASDGAAGILVYATGTGVEISGNTLTGNQFGIGSVGAPSLNIHNNTITGLEHTGNAYPVGVAIWSGDGSAADVATSATVANNTIDTHDHGLLILDHTAGAPSPSATASGNSFTHNHVQVASTEGTIDIPTTLGANTFDLAVTVSGSPYLPFIWSHIQDGVNAAASGDTVHVNPGTYVENITIPTPLNLAGTDQTTTIIQPAVSKPTCGSGESGSLCLDALNHVGASNLILVQASDVAIHGFTLDGDNPGLSGGFDVGGANVDARNGIITNSASGVFNNLAVYNTTVKNIYLRGIYASSGGSFDFHDNRVSNVQAEYASIAMFAYGGPGIFRYNTVDHASDAISANHSKGIQFLYNTVSNSQNGVHTDNAGDGGGVADLIRGNMISNCTGTLPDGNYGIFVFVPYIAPTVDQNTITNCAQGLSAFGQGAAVTTTFTNNTVTGPGATGAFITTDQLGWGSNSVSVSFSGNVISAFTTGVQLTADSTRTNTTTFHCNQISGNAAGVTTAGAGTITDNFENNWWGSATGPNPPGSGDSIVAGINATPWLATPGCSSSIQVYIAGAPKGTYDIAPGTAERVNYPGVDSGPVKVQSTNGKNFVAAERDAWWDGSTWSDFNQLMGLPAGVVSDTYMFPAYNSNTLDEQLRFGNVGTSDTVVTVTIGGVVRGTYPLHPSESTRVNYWGLDSGPVVLKSSGAVPIIAAERNSWWDGKAWSSYSQLMGLPVSQVSDTYIFPAYNSNTLDEQLRFGNVGTSDTVVTVTIGGVVRGTYPLHPSESTRVNYWGLDSGPVVVKSSAAVPIIAAERELLVGRQGMEQLLSVDGTACKPGAGHVHIPSVQQRDARRAVAVRERRHFGYRGDGDDRWCSPRDLPAAPKRADPGELRGS